MDKLPPILVVLLLVAVTTKAEYLFTMPRGMEAGTTTQYCMTLKGYTSTDAVNSISRTITIINPETNATLGRQELVSGKNGDLSDWSSCDELPVPDKTGDFRVKAKVSIDDDTIFMDETNIKIKRPELITLVQTDKPIYKPGQTVKFRAMTMDYKLYAKTTGFPKISIMAPNGMKIMEWTDVAAPNGFISLEMPLSSDPILGDWKIVANDGFEDVEETFKVDEYVLPKFEVTVTPPTYLLPTTPKISGTVCAKYTYGKPVKGTLKMEVCYKADWVSSYYDVRPCAQILEKIDGCFDFYINADDIKLGRRGYAHYGDLRINASVTEDATGIELFGDSRGPSLTDYPLTMEIQDDSDNYFKPGLPFRGRVIVKNPDGTPAPGEDIAVSGTAYNARYDWKKNFTSDENGIVHFVLTDIGPDTGSLNLKAEAIMYQTDWRYTTDELYFKTYTPTAWSYLKQFYSASNSFVYIKDIDQKVDCDSTLMLDVFYNTVPETRYTFHGIVKAGDRVVQTVEHKHEFDGTVADLDLLSIDQDQILQKFWKVLAEDCVAGQYYYWSTQDCQPCPQGQYQSMPGQSYCNYCKANETSSSDRTECIPMPPTPEVIPYEPEIIRETVPFLGTPVRKKRNAHGDDKLLTHFTMEVPVTQDMAPNAKVLVYYIRDDFEVVATSVEFNIKSCFRNQVKMEFLPTTVRPGNDVNLHLEAAPESTCFVGMVDKSINLLGGSNQLTPAQVFENVQRVARPWSWVSYWQEDRDYCESIKSPSDSDTSSDDEPYPYYYHYSYSRPEGADSVFAFRDVEMWVVTDTVLQTRPCKEYRPPVFYDSYGSYDEGGVRLLGTGHAPDDNDEALGIPAPEPKQEPVKIRSLFPETWLWDTVSVGTCGQPETVKESVVDTTEVIKDDGSITTEAKPTKIYDLFPETWLHLEEVSSREANRNIYFSLCKTEGKHRDDAMPMPLMPESSAPELGAPVPMPRGEKRRKTQTSISNTQTTEPEPPKIRSLFPETWLWDIFSVGGNGMVNMPTTIPDTITNWVGNSLCTHPDAGVGVTEITEVTAFQPFFLSFTLPYSAVRGEVVPVLVTVFNYLSECLAMEVRLSEGEGFQLSVGVSSRQFCLCGGQSESTKFNIVPTVVGEIDIEAIAVSIPNENTCTDVVLSLETVGVSDGVQRQLLIEAEGVPQEVTESIYLCTDTYSPDTVMSIDMALPEDLVPDSERATVSVIGDIMGPTLSNLKNLLRMPYGCGEQNMASWSPNIYVLQYLSNTAQITDKIEEEAKGYMRSGYQRQMKYRHNDFSYSAWGENSYGNATGSLWLTAFVVKSMAQSMPYITIDGEDVMQSMQWMMSTQLTGASSGNKEGCFPQVGKVFSSYMKGGLADGENPAGLTAFVLIALLEAKVDINHPAIRLGFQCLDRHATGDTYTLAIMAYAYSLYDRGSPVRQQIMSELERRKISASGLDYWKREDSEFSEEDRATRYWYRAPSAEVEMTAYVLMAKLVAEGPNALASVQPIIQWLTRQRNPYGGFSSTQDTVVALQALARFASLAYSGDTNLQLEVKGPGIDHVFTVTPDNSLLYQSQPARAGQGDISFSVTGQGCAMLQVAMKYNIFKLEEEGPAFEVKIGVFRSRAFRSKCDRRTIEVCTSYLKAGGVSNMAIAEVKMPTGWEPVVETLDLLVDGQRIAKYESDEGFVELYFDSIGRQRQCVEFDVTQEILLNPKPARVTVYDYYETKYSVVTLYEIKTFCGTKEELPFPEPGDVIDDMVQRRIDTSSPIRAGRLTCPVCLTEAPTESTQADMICDSGAVFKAIVGRAKRYPAKVKANLRTQKKTIIDVFVQYRMREDCDCPVLNMGETRVLIFTSPTNLNTEDELLTLDEGTKIIAVTKTLEKKVRELSKYAKRCDKLKRRRRSKAKKELMRRNRNNRRAKRN